ncbi:MAG: putative metalloprotease CJM1_0395 family protein [Pseudomonadota bacterium]
MIGAVGSGQSLGFEKPAVAIANADPSARPASAERADAQTARPVEKSGSATRPEKEKPGDPGAPKTATGEELSEGEEKQVQDLKQRDREVRAHEQAHAAVGGPYAGAPQYQFTTGPDGKKYAVSGEVQIDASPERDPEATVRKMDIVIRAALAPAEPSSQDLAVARQAQETRQKAQAEITKARADGRDPSASAKASSSTSASERLAATSAYQSTAETFESQAAQQAATAEAIAQDAFAAAAQIFG